MNFCSELKLNYLDGFYGFWILSFQKQEEFNGIYPSAKPCIFIAQVRSFFDEIESNFYAYFEWNEIAQPSNVSNVLAHSLVSVQCACVWYCRKSNGIVTFSACAWQRTQKFRSMGVCHPFLCGWWDCCTFLLIFVVVASFYTSALKWHACIDFCCFYDWFMSNITWRKIISVQFEWNQLQRRRIKPTNPSYEKINAWRYEQSKFFTFFWYFKFHRKNWITQKTAILLNCFIF